MFYVSSVLLWVKTSIPWLTYRRDFGTLSEALPIVLHHLVGTRVWGGLQVLTHSHVIMRLRVLCQGLLRHLEQWPQPPAAKLKPTKTF